mgnify:CR=1 FL=1
MRRMTFLIRWERGTRNIFRSAFGAVEGMAASCSEICSKVSMHSQIVPILAAVKLVVDDLHQPIDLFLPCGGGQILSAKLGIVFGISGLFFHMRTSFQFGSNPFCRIWAMRSFSRIQRMRTALTVIPSRCAISSSLLCRSILSSRSSRSCSESCSVSLRSTR